MRSESSPLELSVVIPTYNERQRLPRTLKEVDDYLHEHFKGVSEIVVCDCNSPDGTADFVRGFKSKIPLEVVGTLRRGGKGLAVRKGIMSSKGAWVIFMDADGSTNIRELDRLLQYGHEADVIIGSRYSGIEISTKQSLPRQVVSKIGRATIRLITGLKIRDTQCGFKLFSRDAANAIFSRVKSRRWGFDVEALLLAKKLGFKTKEVAVHWHDEEGSHLNAVGDSVKTLVEVVEIVRRVNKEQK